MKNFQFIIFALLVFSSCEKAQPAMVEVRLNIDPIARTGDCNLSLGQIELYEYNQDSTKIVRFLDNFISPFLTFQFAQGFNKTLFFGEQSDLNVAGIKLIVTSGFGFDPNFFVFNILEFEEEVLGETILVEEDHFYLIDIDLDITEMIRIDSVNYDLKPKMKIEFKKR